MEQANHEYLKREAFDKLIRGNVATYQLELERFNIVEFENKDGFKIEFGAFAFLVEYPISNFKSHTVITFSFPNESPALKKIKGGLTLSDIEKYFIKRMQEIKFLRDSGYYLNEILRDGDRKITNEKIKKKLNDLFEYLFAAAFIILVFYFVLKMGGGSSSDHFYRKP